MAAEDGPYCEALTDSSGGAEPDPAAAGPTPSHLPAHPNTPPASRLLGQLDASAGMRVSVADSSVRGRAEL